MILHVVHIAMHPLTQPAFEAARIFIQRPCLCNAAMIEAEPLRKIADLYSMTMDYRQFIKVSIQFYTKVALL